MFVETTENKRNKYDLNNLLLHSSVTCMLFIIYIYIVDLVSDDQDIDSQKVVLNFF